MSVWTEPTTCELCDHKGTDVRRRELVHWKVAPPGMSWEHIDRCVDRTACRRRFHDQTGEEWPLIDPAREERTA